MIGKTLNILWNGLYLYDAIARRVKEARKDPPKPPPPKREEYRLPDDDPRRPPPGLRH